MQMLPTDQRAAVMKAGMLCWGDRKVLGTAASPAFQITSAPKFIFDPVWLTATETIQLCAIGSRSSCKHL